MSGVDAVDSRTFRAGARREWGIRMDMYRSRRATAWIGGIAAGVLLGCGLALGQGETGDGTVETVVKSLPSEIMPMTPRSLLLDIVNTGRHLIAVGDRGAVIVSNDGRRWAQVQTPTRSALTAVHFPDPDHGWAVGHDAVILHTADGGRTWTLQNFEPELEKPFLDVLFLDAQRGYAVGAYGLFYKTEDGGQTWSEVDTPIRENEWHFNSITRLNDGTLLIAGENGTLAVSTDGGVTWAAQPSPYESSFFGATARGEKGAVIFGLRGNVFVTDDIHGGQWHKVDTGSVASMFGGTQLEDGRVVLVGLNGNIMVSENGLERVELLRSNAGTPLSAAIGFGGEVIAVGESGVQHIALNR